MTGFGTLIADIWGYTSRSLTGFGTLIADIWSHNTRTLTSADLNSGTLATQSQVIGVATSLANIESKIDTINTSISTLVNKWGSYSAGDIINGVSNVTDGIGDTGDLCGDNTVFGGIACVEDRWGSQTAETLYTMANNAINIGNTLRSELGYSGKSTTAYENLQTLASYVDELETRIGENTDLASATTLFGKIKNNEEKISTVGTTLTAIDAKIDILDNKIETIGGNLDTILIKWGSYGISDIMDKLNSVTIGLGSTNDTCSNNSVFGNIACVEDKWGSQTAETLYTVANNALSVGSSLRMELDYNGKSTTAYQDMQMLKNYIDSLESKVGENGDLSTAETLFGKLKKNEEDIAGVQTTVNSIVAKVDALAGTVEVVDGNIDTILTKWGSYSLSQVIEEITEVSTKIGETGDICAGGETIYSGIDCIQNNPVTVDNSQVLAAIAGIGTTVANIQSELNYNGKSTTAYSDIQSLSNSMGILATAIGSNNDNTTTNTLFGKVNKIQATVETLETTGSQATTIIDHWGSYTAEDIYNKVKDLSSQISEINTVSNVNSILSVGQSNAIDLQALKNQVLAIKTLTSINKELLEKTTNKPIVKTWLEEGSIIFKTMIINPANNRQTVAVDYYLPKEADKKNIINLDPGLDVTYDSQQAAYKVTGEYDLEANETKIVSIEVEDVWKISDSEINSLKSQTEDLMTALNNTSYYAQGVTLKSDILVQLENIKRTQGEAITPDSKIETYRNNIQILGATKNEIEDLKGLVTAASGNGSLMGFVGGAQTLSLWGVITVLIVGIVFLTVYFKVMLKKINHEEVLVNTKHQGMAKIKNINFKMPKINKHVGLAIVFLVTFGTISKITSSGLNKSQPQKQIETQIQPTESTTQPTSIPTSFEEKKDEKVLGETSERIKIKVPEGSTSIKIREYPNGEAPIINRIWAARTVDKYSENGEWIEIETEINNQNIRGWIRKLCWLQSE